MVVCASILTWCLFLIHGFIWSESNPPGSYHRFIMLAVAIAVKIFCSLCSDWYLNHSPASVISLKIDPWTPVMRLFKQIKRLWSWHEWLYPDIATKFKGGYTVEYWAWSPWYSCSRWKRRTTEDRIRLPKWQLLLCMIDNSEHRPWNATYWIAAITVSFEEVPLNTYIL